ncbi:DUF881 domain-containing protein [soil metagenome]
MRWPTRGVTPAADDPAASMALLTEVLERPVDPGYHTAAATRVAHGRPPQTSRRSPVFVISVLLLGFLFSVAAIALRTPDPQDLAERTELAERIEAQEQAGDDDAAMIEDIRADIADLEAAQSGGPGSDIATRIAATGEQAGGVALHGPGVVVTLDDATSDELEPVTEPGSVSDRVLAADLQTLVNGLWANGAEAISINEQRLTSTSSIRFAGEAIIVDFRGLNRPYVVRAIGDPEALAAEVESGGTGRYLGGVSSEYGIAIEWEEKDDVQIPAAERLNTRVARVDDGELAP